MPINEPMNLAQTSMIIFLFFTFSLDAPCTQCRNSCCQFFSSYWTWSCLWKCSKRCSSTLLLHFFFFSIGVPQSDANIFVLGRRERKLFHQGLKIDFMMNLDALQLRKDHQSWVYGEHTKRINIHLKHKQGFYCTPAPQEIIVAQPSSRLILSY